MTIAWSDAFDEDRLGPVRPLRLPTPITRSWAFGDGRGTGVRVAVVDSGVDGDHPWVGGVDRAVALEPGGHGTVTLVEGHHEDLYGHGTACAGIVRRLAPGVELWSVRVLGPTLTGRGAVLAAAIEWCIDNGVDVVNLSLSSRSAAMKLRFHELADAAAFADVMLVCAGNNVAAPSYPSTFSPVFSVAAAPGDDVERLLVNPRPPVEFGAPGHDVEVAWSGGGTVVSSGNSFAAPVVAGHLARLIAQHPQVTVAEAKSVLRAVAANRDGPSAAGRD